MYGEILEENRAKLAQPNVYNEWYTFLDCSLKYCHCLVTLKPFDFQFERNTFHNMQGSYPERQ